MAAVAAIAEKGLTGKGKKASGFVAGGEGRGQGRRRGDRPRLMTEFDEVKKVASRKAKPQSR